MRFNILAHNNVLGIAAEVFMLPPVMLIADHLHFLSLRAFNMIGGFSDKQLPVKEVALQHQLLYHTTEEQFPYSWLVTNYNKMQSITRPTHEQIVAIEKGRKIMKQLRQDVKHYYDHYCVQYGFQVLKPYVHSELLTVMVPPLIKDDYEVFDEKLVDELAKLLQPNEAVVLNQFAENHLNIKFVKGDVIPSKGDVIAFPLVSFPVLKQFTQLQMDEVYHGMKNVRESFNRNFESLARKLKECPFSKNEFKNYAQKIEEYLSKDIQALNKISDENIYMNQLRNSGAEDGTVTMYIGITSAEKLLHAYENMVMVKRMHVDALRNRLPADTDFEQPVMFLYVNVDAPEVNGDKDVTKLNW